MLLKREHQIGNQANVNPSIRAHGSLINNHRCKPRRNKILGGFERLEVRRLLADWFAAPTGVATNAGTFDSPWDLTTALNNVNVIDPGDTLFLRGGAYRHPDRSHGSTGYGFHLDGAEGAPVTVRPYFDEHAIIDGGLHVSQGTSSQYLTITGLEVIVSENVTGNRTSTISGSSYPADLNRPAGGVEITSGYAIKFVNNVVRDNAQGITFSRSVGGSSELHGNIIYDNGWLGPDRPHGPAFYAQNGADGWKYITDNLAFDNYTRTLQAYGSANTSVDRFYIARNIFFDDVPSSKHDALVGGEAPIHDILVENNVAYGVDIRLGWVDGGDGIVVRNNHVRGEIEYKEFSEITTNNNWEWGLTDAQPTVDGVPVAVPASPRVFFNVNAYDSRRANLAIMNHLGATQVLVNPGTFLKSGDTYRIMDPTNLWGAPITSGVYNGGSLNVPTPGPFAAYVVFASSGPTNTPPTISDFAHVSLNVGETVPLRTFTIADVQTAASALVVTATSSNPALVPSTGLILGGSGANRNLSVRPTTGATGFSDITVTVRDAGGLTKSDVFRVTVTDPSVNTPPTMTNLTNVTTLVGELIPLRSFVVGDAETAPGSLSVQVASSNLALVPSSGLVLGGSGANRTLKITPAPNATGVTTISVWVRDAAGLLAKDIFRVTVQPTANNTAPSVTDLSNITALVGDSIPMRPFTVGDAETPAGSLSVTGSSSNPSLAPTSGLVLGGGGANRTLKITPTPNMTGDASISIWVRDAQGNLAKDVFRVYVNPLTAIAPMTSPNLADQSSPVTSTRNMIWADSEAAHAFDALLLARATKRTMQSENGAREALWFATLNQGISVSRTAFTAAIDSIFEEQSAAAP